MRSRAKLPCSETQLEIAIILFCCLCAFPILAAAQGAPGLNAVCSSTSVCSSSSDTVGTSAFIDASMFVGSVPSPTFCSVLNDVLAHVIQPTYPNGAVIDARGLPGTNASMACSTSPWGSGSGYLVPLGRPSACGNDHDFRSMGFAWEHKADRNRHERQQ
jgi:hypothetical protein